MAVNLLGQPPVSPVDAQSGRVIQYTPPGAQTVILPYSSIRVQVANEYIARQESFKVYRYDVVFYVSGAGSGFLLQDRLNHLRRHLMKSRGVFEVFDQGTLLFYAGPATTPTVPGINVTSGNTVTTQISYDIDQGPRPLNFFVNEILGLTARVEWSLQVRATSEDSVSTGNPEISFMDSRVTYSIDQVGGTTRRLSGRIGFRNIRAEAVAAQFWNSGAKRRDIDPSVRKAFRKFFARGAANLRPYLETTFSVPARFVRLTQDYDVEENENVLRYSLVDREIRGTGLPPDVLLGDVSMRTHTEGWWGLQPVYRTVSGSFEGPLNGAMPTLLFRAIQVLNSLLDFDNLSSFTYVTTMDFLVPQMYMRNRIEFSFVAITPYALMVTEWDKFMGMRNPSLPIATSHSTTVVGTGGLTGSGYAPQTGEAASFSGSGATVADFATAFFDDRRVTDAEGDDFQTRRQAMSRIDVDVKVVKGDRVAVSNLQGEGQTKIYRNSQSEVTITIHLSSIFFFRFSGEKRAIAQGIMRKVVGLPDVHRIGRVVHSQVIHRTNNAALGSVKEHRMRGPVVIKLNGAAIAAAASRFANGLDGFDEWAETTLGPGEGIGSIAQQIAVRLGL